MNFTTPKFGGNESWKKLFWMKYNSESICMCWKHKTKTAQCHCGIIFFNVGWNCAALVWASIVANLFLSCNRFFLMSPLHDLPLIIKWHLIRKNSALCIIFQRQNSLDKNDNFLVQVIFSWKTWKFNIFSSQSSLTINPLAFLSRFWEYQPELCFQQHLPKKSNLQQSYDKNILVQVISLDFWFLSYILTVQVLST